jgi:hypothetical protein
VHFENNTQNVKTLLITDGGSRFYCTQPCHDVNVIRELFGAEGMGIAARGVDGRSR